MTGALQTYARKTKIPIDTLTFRTVVLDKFEHEVTAGPENGVYVYGLYLQGAQWDLKVRLGDAGALNHAHSLTLAPNTACTRAAITHGRARSHSP